MPCQDLLEFQDEQLKGKNFSEEDKQKVLNDREAVLSLQPGESVDNGYNIYKMNNDGSITCYNKDSGIEIGSFDDLGINIAAANCGNETIRRVEARNRERVEDNMDGFQLGPDAYKINHPQTIKISSDGVKTVYNSTVNTSVQGTQISANVGINSTPTPVADNNNPAPMTESNTETPAVENNTSGISDRISQRTLANGDIVYFVQTTQVSKEEYEAALNMDQTVVDAGFFPGAECDITINEDDSYEEESVHFAVHDGKYFVDNKEVDSNEFLQKYNDALKEQAKNEIEWSVSNKPYRVFGNEDYSKYKKK